MLAFKNFHKCVSTIFSKIIFEKLYFILNMLLLCIYTACRKIVGASHIHILSIVLNTRIRGYVKSHTTIQSKIVTAYNYDTTIAKQYNTK